MDPRMMPFAQLPEFEPSANAQPVLKDTFLTKLGLPPQQVYAGTPTAPAQPYSPPFPAMRAPVQSQVAAPQRTIRVTRGSMTGPMTETDYGRNANGGYDRLPSRGEQLQAMQAMAAMRPKPTPAKDVAGLGYLNALNSRLTRQMGQAAQDPAKLLAAENAYILDLQKWLAAAGIAPGAIFGNNVE